MRSRMMGRTVAGILALGAAALALSLTMPTAMAASAISIDPATLAFAYRLGDDAKDLEKSAQTQCKSLGGKQCGTQISCQHPGYGAVAADRGTLKIAGACGLSSKAAATSSAMDKCRAAGGSDCAIAAEYHDTIPSFSLEQAYFKGQWAASCRARNSRKASFVAAKEFRLDRCVCRLFKGGKCALRRCSATQEVYSPGTSDGNYVAPTYGTSIRKLDDNHILLTGNAGGRTLMRCPG